MNDPVSQREPGKWGCLWVTLALLPIVYVLSPVPVSFLYMQLPEPIAEPIGIVLEPLYTPIGWAYENFESVQAFYDWQLELFGLI